MPGPQEYQGERFALAFLPLFTMTGVDGVIFSPMARTYAFAIGGAILLSFTLTVFTLSIGIVIGTLITGGVKAAKDDKVAPGATPLVIPNPVELSNAFTQIAKSVEPSVVNISTTYLPKAPTQSPERQRTA